MPPSSEYKAWDLSSPVSELLKTLASPPRPKYERSITPKEPASAAAKGTKHESTGSLGDFSKIFEFLGTVIETPTPKALSPHPLAFTEKNRLFATTANQPIEAKDSALAKPEQERVPLAFEQKKDYTSDGAVYHPPVSKGVRFRDWPVDDDSEESPPNRSQDSGDETTSTCPDTIPDTPSASTKTIKNQEKKARKKANKLARAAAALQTKATSDVEYAPRRVHSPSKSPARKASVHTVPADPTTPPQASESKPRIRKPKSKNKVEDTTTKEPKSKPEIAPVDDLAVQVKGESSPPKQKIRRSDLLVPSQLPPVTPDRPIFPRAVASERPVARPSLQPSFQSYSMTPSASVISTSKFSPYVVDPEFYGPCPYPRQQGSRIPISQLQTSKANPFIVRHDTDRHEHFFLELLKQFPNDKRWLLSPAAMSNHSTNPDGIHVFIDASNIFIGFFEHLKRLFGLKQGRIEGLRISFDALVLLLERRRPVAKRCVVGSEGNVPAFEMAKAIGYETSILAQVYKDLELPKRQRRFYYQNSINGNNGNAGGYANASNVPEMVPNAYGYVPASPTRPGDAQKWVEQGVDELLHLKMLESIVDADNPGTMVLATGDAAVAEYSQGFMKMVDRALKKGWAVELIAWGISINKAYRDPAFRRKWGDRFRIVELDDFAEDLLDT